MEIFRAQDARFMVSTEDGVRAMVEAIEKGKAQAYVPPLPWAVLGPLRKVRGHTEAGTDFTASPK